RRVVVHLLNICPYDTIGRRLSGRGSEDLDVAQIHDPESIELSPLGGDGEIHRDSIEAAWRRAVGTYSMLAQPP
ncbi:MAG: hypothetical protein Q9183_002792, partial [Haloplaca sp. 2 TL-2023]